MTGKADSAGQSIVQRVRALYEAHPYPKYPLLAKPRWREGFLTHSRFAQALAGFAPSKPATSGERAQVLIGGSGEILPYIIRRWEPRDNAVVSLDLSARSLRRARWRLLTSTKPTSFVRGDLDAYLAAQAPARLAHVDAFGVLHHMRDPGETLRLIARGLVPGGTVRLMVYNAGPRRWIHHLQRAFALLDLEACDGSDLKVARRILLTAVKGSPALAARLAQVGMATIASDARLADLLLHPREARLDVTWWLRAIGDAGLKIVGLLDRYGELDDLPNPLWQAPDATALAPRAADRRYEGNLEVFLQKPGGLATPIVDASPVAPLGMGTGPALWWSFAETSQVAPALRSRIWRAHRAFVERRVRALSDRDLVGLPLAALGRLARLGALLPGQIRGVRDLVALAPLSQALDAPAPYGPAEAPNQELIEFVRAQCRDRPSRGEAALRRIMAARET